MADPNIDPRVPQINKVIQAIEMRLDEAKDRETYDDMRVDLLAVIHYIERNLRLIDQRFPPDDGQ